MPILRRVKCVVYQGMLWLLATLSAHAAVFGADDRALITPSSPYATLARSTAVAVLSSNFALAAPGRIALSVDSLSTMLCPSEKFTASPSLSYACTGFLVAPDLLATAGHCLVNTGEERHETQTYCAAFSWLFDYTAEADPKNIPAENLYACREVVYAVRDEKPPFRDFALVRLNRAVPGRAPLKLNPQGALTNLSMIGYPLGAPAIVSSGARVLKNDPARQSFLTNLDAFEGNSGSPVLNAANEVVGILVGGTPSASLIPATAPLTCQRYNRCDENGEHCLLPDGDTSALRGYQGVGSEVQRIAPLEQMLP